jgi:hypothetical protein
MYLTAQHIRNDAGEEDLHVFLHLHGPDSGALSDPWSVPHVNPGRLVPDSLPRRIAPGGNSVLSYLDIIADDAIGAAVLPDPGAPPQPWWESALESVGKSMSREPLPWVVSLAGIHVIFSVAPEVHAREEYARLLAAAVARWGRWSEQAVRLSGNGAQRGGASR